MGRDKFENEDLIKWGLPTDVWFHVDSLSSAHVYLRFQSEEYDIDNIPKDVMEECLQIVKHNSIEGCKLKSVKICYTPWENLDKSPQMEVGQVGYKNNKEVRYTHVEKNREMIKALNKTMVERTVDLEQENNSYHKEQLKKKKKAYEEMKRKKAQDEEEKKKDISNKRFEYLHDNTCLVTKTNKNAGDDDDFM